MAVVGEHHDAPEAAVHHAALAHVAGEQHQLLAVAAPVHGQGDAAGMDRLRLLQEVPLRVEEAHDPGVLPEVGGDVLQPGHVVAELADGGGLRVPDAVALQDLPLQVEHQERLVARRPVDARRRLRIGGEVADGDRVDVVLQVAGPGPELPAGVVPHPVPDEELVAAVAVHVERERVVPGVLRAFPQEREVRRERPDVVVAVLEQEVALAGTGEAGEDDRVAAVELVRPRLVLGGHGRHPHPALHLARARRRGPGS